MLALHMKPTVQVHGSAKSSFNGLNNAFRRLNVSAPAIERSSRLQVEGEDLSADPSSKFAQWFF